MTDEPIVAGFYWGKKKGAAEWQFIAQVSGIAPFLTKKIVCHIVPRALPIHIGELDDFDFGPRVDPPQEANKTATSVATKTFYVWGDDKCKSRIEAASPQEAAKKLVDYACNNRIPICHGVYVSEVGYPNDPNPNIYSTRELCRTIDRECLAGTYSRFEGPLSS